MLPAQVASFEGLVRDGVTLRRLTNGGKKFANTYVCSLTKFRSHAAEYPVWGAEMERKLAGNAKAMDARKGDGRRRRGNFCLKGHSLAEHGSTIKRGGGKAYMLCGECQRIATQNAPIPTMEKVGLAMAAMMSKKPISVITNAAPTSS